MKNKEVEVFNKVLREILERKLEALNKDKKHKTLNHEEESR